MRIDGRNGGNVWLTAVQTYETEDCCHRPAEIDKEHTIDNILIRTFLKDVLYIKFNRMCEKMLKTNFVQCI